MTEYLLHQKADIGPCMDVRGYGGRIYAIQRQNGGRLAVFSEELAPISAYGGIGNARQIEIKDGLAAISAREDGLWLFDVRHEAPLLLSHYRTVEFATGITLYKSFVLVSCRQYGVEIVDIRDPKSPRYVGVIRIGEAQSACVYRDVLYGGVWGEMKVVAVDISDIEHPKRLADLPLTGRGDGVTVRDGILYAVTGQHRRGIESTTDKNDPFFGMGNGVEVYDVSDPANAKRLSWSFFEKGYSVSFDMWKPMLAGDVLLCNDSILGIYGYDSRTMQKIFHISLPEIGGEPDPVTGTTVHGGRLYVSSGRGGLYRFDEIEFENAYRYDEEGGSKLALPTFSCEGEGAMLTQIYHGDFPVLAVSEVSGGHLALATGDGGVRVLRAEDLCTIVSCTTDGFCYDATAHGDTVFAALGEKGIGVYRFDGGELWLVSQTAVGGTVQQLALSENGQFLAVTLGSTTVKMLDVRDAAHPCVLYEMQSKKGPLYGENFLSHPHGGKGISLFWHRTGLVYSDPEGGDRSFSAVEYPMKKGFTGYCPGNGCDIDGENILFVRRGGYILLPRDGAGYADELPAYRAEHPIRGKLCVSGKYLIATERAEGIVTVTDISDIRCPVSVARLETNASPSKAYVTSGGEILVAGRYAGLLALTLENPK